MKFGGTSLASLSQVRRTARTVVEATKDGRPAVVVVSARGAATDELLAEAHALSGSPLARELDQLLITGETASAALLAMALHDLGRPAVSLSGAQAGMFVSGPHTAGRVESILDGRIGAAMRAGQIAVVAGFHGLNAAGDVVTLGRGGSDTSAVAVAAAFGARTCEIYTDVDGVFTADPRVVPSARLIPELDAAVMAEMAFAGAKVLHSRSVHLADRFGIDIHVRNSAHDGPGTIVRARGKGGSLLETDNPLAGIAHATGLVRIVAHQENPGSDRVAFLAALAARAIPVDVVTTVPDGLDVTVPGDHLNSVLGLASQLGHRCDVTPWVAKVSLLGSGLLDRPEYAARTLSCLDREGIAVHSVVLSQLRCAVTIDTKNVVDAVRSLHQEFELDLDMPTGESMVGTTNMLG